MDFEARREHRPRSASVGRPERGGASADIYGGAAGAYTRPASAGRGLGSTAPAKNRSRPPSANAVASPRAANPAWSPSPAEGGGGGGPVEAPKRKHVQALAMNRPPEKLAEDVVMLKEQVNRLTEEQKLRDVERRRLEGELSRARASLLKSEELLNNKERLIGSPTMGISQLYRSPDTTSLVASLKEQVRELRAQCEGLSGELSTMQRSTRATRVAELQAELMEANKEMDRLARINSNISGRLDAAETAAAAAVAEAQSARRTMEEYVAVGSPLEGPVKLAPANSLSGTTVRKTLLAMHQAHKALIGQAQLIRSVFPPGLSMTELAERARQRSNTAGAPDVLNFLRNHVAKVNIELMGQPGAPVASPDKGARPSSATASPGQQQRARGEEGSEPAAPARPNHEAVLRSIAEGVRKLRGMDSERLAASPDVEAQCQQLADVMELYLEEVARLTGRNIAAAKAKQQAELAKVAEVEAGESAAAAASAARAAQQQAEIERLQAALRDAEARAEAAAADQAKAAEEAAEALAEAKAAAAAVSPAPAAASPVFVAPRSPEAPSVPAVPAAAEGPLLKFVVHTSDVSGGAFDGTVYVELHGKDGSRSGEAVLPSDRYSFDTGQADEFKTRVPSAVGLPLQSLGLRMEASDRNDLTWHVDRVEVFSESGESLGVFRLVDWVRPGPANLLFQAVPSGTGSVEYEVTVKTSDIRGAGTDGSVFITLVGDAGAAQEVQLNMSVIAPGSSSDADHLFSRGAADKFMIKVADVGDISHVTVRLAAPDGSPALASALHSSWSLSTVEVLHTETGMASLMYCNDYLTPTEPRLTLAEATTWQAKSLYRVRVYTSDLKGADFEGLVTLNLSGWWGSTAKPLRLLPRATATKHFYQRAGMDEFYMRGDDVGPVTSVTVNVEPSGDNVTWHLDRLEVTNEATGDNGTFYLSNWITSTNPSATIYKRMPMVDYKVVVYTSQVANAKFDGKVYIACKSGMYGSMEETQLMNDSGDAANNALTFEAGCAQEFNIKGADVGVPSELDLRIEATGRERNWHLDRVELTVTPSTGSTTGSGPAAARLFVFRHGDWVNADAAAGSTSVTLKREVDMVEYKLTVHTSDSDEAGFDGDVYLTIQGLDGETEELRLTGADVPKPFDRATTSTFTVKAADVGAFGNLKVRVDATGSLVWWLLDRVDVTHTKSGNIGVYPYRSWISASSYPNATLYQQSLNTYTLTVVATPADQLPQGASTAAFDGDVYVQINGSGDEIKVPEPLAPGAPVTFTAKSTQTWAYAANVRVAPRGSSRLHLAWVEMKNETSGDCNYFPHRSWLGKDDGESAYLSAKARVEYKVVAHTSSARDGGLTGGSAFITLIGVNGEDSGELALAPSDATASFTSGSALECALQTFHFGELKSARVRVADGKGRWTLSRLEVTNLTHGGAMMTFYNGLGGIQIPGTVAFELLETLEYQVSVQVSDLRGNGTDGCMSVRLIGDKGSSEELDLNADTGADQELERGATTKYTVSCTDVGKLSSVVLRLKAPKPAWGDATAGVLHSHLHVAQVDVLHSGSGVLTSFSCNKWLETAGAEETLFADGASSVYQEYLVTVVPGSSWQGPCNGTMYVRLHGDSQSSHRIKLAKDAAEVQHDNTCIFRVSAADVGPLQRIDFELGSDSDCSYYYLGRVQVLNSSTHKGGLFKYTDYVYNWNGQYTICKASSDCSYRVDVYTNNFDNASFDGSVFITLHGATGDSEEQQLSSYWYTCFQRGATDSFWISSPDVGALSAITMRAERTGSSAKWDLGHVEVCDDKTSARSTFEYNKALPTGAKGVRIEKRTITVPYEITVVTTDVRGASTDGDVYLSLSGSLGTLDWVKLTNDSGSMFARGATDTFNIKGVDVGDKTTLSLRLDQPEGSDSLHSSWHVSTVSVLNKETGVKASYNINAWVPRYNSTSAGESSSQQVLNAYKVRVTTSQLKGSDFDGKVFITIHGWWGSTEELQLVLPGRSQASFKAGYTDEFTVRGLDVGGISAVTVRMEPTDSDPSWHLDRIEVENTSGNNYKGEFFWGNWLNKDTSSTYIYRQQPLTDYTVNVFTGSSEGATFDGDVYLTLNGMYGGTTETLLVNDTGRFDAGTTQEFAVKGTDVSALSSLDIRVVPSGKFSKWQLERVEVRSAASPDKVAVFKHEAGWVETSGGAAANVSLQRDIPVVEYKVTVKTGDPADALFDGTAYITLHGMEGSSEEVKLSSEDGSIPVFAAGSSITLAVKAKDVGALNYVAVRVDKTGTSSQWYLAQLEVTRPDTGYYSKLTYNSYVYLDWNSYAFLYPQSSTDFVVALRTGDAPDATFDGDVYIKLCNWWNETEPIKLANENKVLQPGSTQVYTIASPNVSWLTSVSVSVATTGQEKKWQLAYLTVHPSSDPSCIKGFISDRDVWLGKGDGLEDNITLSASSVTEYTVVMTLHQDSDPFDGALFVSCIGDSSTRSNEETLLPGGSDVLTGGETRTLGTVKLSDVGTISEVRLRAARAGTAERFRPATLLLKPTSGGSGVMFYVSSTKPVELPGLAVAERVAETDLAITLVSSDVRGNGTDADVYIALVGEKGTTDEMQLGSTGQSSILERGQTNTFMIKAADVGTLSKIIVRLKDPGSSTYAHSEWNLDHVDVVHTQSGTLTKFPHNGWINTYTAVELQPAGSEQAFIDYTVWVRTSSDTSAWFDGSVRLRLEGESGSVSHDVQLGKGDSSTGVFQSGALDTFNVRAANVGTLKRVHAIALYDGSTSSWRLGYVEVMNNASQEKQRFTLDGWVYTWSEATAIELAPQISYYVEAYTAQNGTDFDGSAFITLHGELGDSQECALSSYWSTTCTPGSSTYYYINTFDVGALTAITVRADRNGTAAKWALGYVDVTNQSTYATAHFEYNSSVAAGGSGARIPKRVVMVDYEVTVYTRDVRAAGTDGLVYIRLSGNSGSTDEIKLDNGSSDNFVRAAVNKFTFNATQIGSNTSVVVRLACPESPEGEAVLHSGWALEKLEVLDKSSGLKTTYVYNSWISRNSGPVSIEESSSVQALNEYRVSVTTSDLKGADFEGLAYIKIHGWRGDTDEMQLVQSGRDTGRFRTSSTDEFVVRGVDVGDINAVTVRMVPSENDPSWHLAQLVVENTANSSKAEFHHNNWLDNDGPSVYLWRTKPMMDYQVTVYTTDLADAGFDGEVNLTIAGSYGSTDSTLLVNSSSRFAPGSTEVFAIKACDVNVLQTISLRIEHTGKEKRWHLDRVEIKNVSTDSISIFIHRDWVDVDVDGGVVNLKKDLPTTDFRVSVVTTADVDDGSFDGTVYLTAYGMDGSTDEVMLVSEDGSKPNFTTGSTMPVMVKAKDVGVISYVQLRVERTGSAQRWHLARVDVTNLASNITGVFNYRSFVWEWDTTVYLYPQTQYTYKVAVTTSAQQTGRFEGPVYVELSNWWSNSGESLLANEKGARFESGATDEFIIKASDLSYINQLKLRIGEPAASDAKAAWQLEKIEVSCDDTASSYTFTHNQPVSGAEPLTLCSKSMYDYELTLFTAPGSAGSFDGIVYATLIGSGDEESNEVQLSLCNVDDSLPVSVLAPGGAVIAKGRFMDIAYPCAIKIRVVHTGEVAKWQLHRVKAYNASYGCTTHFYLGTTLNAPTAMTVKKQEETDYAVIVTTSDVHGNGFDGSVSVIVEGEQHTTEELTLANDASIDFERGRSDVFSFRLPELGVLKKVLVKLAGEPHSAWHLADIAILHKPSGSQTAFPCGRWLDTSSDSAEQLYAAGVQQVYQDYAITVYTSDQSDAAFDGTFFITLEGALATRTYEAGLGAGGNGTFDVSAKNEFTIRAADVGPLSAVLIRTECTGSSSSWRPKRIEVHNKKTNAYGLFTYADTVYTWSGTVRFEKAEASTNYEVYVYVGAMPSGGSMEGEMYLTLHGANGRTEETKLCSWYGAKTTWYADDSTYFSVSGYDVGAVKSAEVRWVAFDGSQTLPLDRIEASTSSASAKFVWSKMLQHDQSIRIDRDMKQTEYELKLTTSDCRGAGTDGRVWVTLIGDDGAMEQEVMLSNGKPAGEVFVRGGTDTFKFKGPVVGANKKMVVRLGPGASASIVHSSWHLGSGNLTDMQSGMRTTFYWSNWVTGSSPVTLTESSTYKALVPYVMRVHTSDIRDAGFVGEVYCKLNGWWGNTDEVKLAHSGAETHDFGRNATDEFIVYIEDIGPVYNLEIRTVPTQGDVSWHLDNIEVFAQGSENIMTFNHDNWLKGAKSASATLYRYMPTVPYTVEVHLGASSLMWDGEVYIDIKGTWGPTGETQLVNDNAAINAGAPETYNINMSDVGGMSSIALRLAQTGATAVNVVTIDKVVVTNNSSGVVATFLGQQLSDATSAVTMQDVDGSGKQVPCLSLTLPRDLPSADYRFTVVTSDVADGSYDGAVVVTLSGQDGTTGEMRLPSETTKHFKSSSTDVFTIKGPDVGPVSSITIKIESNGASAAQWNLDNIQVEKRSAAAPAGAAFVQCGKFAYRGYMNEHNTSTTLYAQGSADYRVTLYTTNDIDNPAFEGTVYMQLSSAWYGNSEEAKLKPVGGPGSKVSALSPGNAAQFTFTASPDVYDISSATLWMEPVAGASSTAWHLDRMEVVQGLEDNGLAPLVFVHKKAVLPGKENNVTLAALSVKSYTLKLFPAVGAATCVNASVHVSLVDADGAATDEVAAVEAGASGYTLPAYQAVTDATFDDAVSMSLNFQTLDVKSLGGIRLRLSTTDASLPASWPVSRAELVDGYGVSHMLAPGANGTMSPAGSVADLHKLPDAVYKVEVETGDVPGAGTDAYIYITIMGAKGCTHKIQLASDYWSEFERGHRDEFTIAAPNVGILQAAKITMADPWNGIHSGWFLASVAVTNLDTRRRHVMSHGDWLHATDSPSATLVDTSGGQVTEEPPAVESAPTSPPQSSPPTTNSTEAASGMPATQDPELPTQSPEPSGKSQTSTASNGVTGQGATSTGEGAASTGEGAASNVEASQQLDASDVLDDATVDDGLSSMM